ncbi:glycosyltransferase [Spirosoma aerolatum]|uniref:glycosyltransferase n=1 Tax=Spirosoma aerolatum TaxID=1211326 RepID=UPI0009AE77D9|nr:glycosyltransferase [Spirosoma aerolatum]
MRILIVCSGNAPNFDVRLHQAFIYEQVEALKQLDTSLQFDYFFIQGKGLLGYLSCHRALLQQLANQLYDCVHAHVTMSSLLANLQRRVPVITTFHGSDINVPKLRMLAMVAAFLSYRTIYISQQLRQKAIYKGKASPAVIPCGVDFERFVPRSKVESRQLLGLIAHKKYILFSSGFSNQVKNYPLAKAAVELLQDSSVELLELKNYGREDVALLFTAVDVALMTSYSEGSPQFVKEALACNCPVVSTDVGDVRDMISDIEGCYLTTYEPQDVAEKLRVVLANPTAVSSRECIRRFDNRLIARQIRDVYQQLL